MTFQRMIFLGIAITLIVVAYMGWKLTSRTAYESAAYTVLETEGCFEIRAYPDLMMATTPMRFRSQGDDGSFMRLFGYISGGNEQQQKVAMTTPVFMEPDDPNTPGQMGFVLPEKVSQQRIPEPSENDVKIRKRDGGRFAVIRFAGRMDEDSLDKSEARLRDWMKQKALEGAGAAEVAGYDPPWTPGPWRRNEVLVRLK